VYVIIAKVSRGKSPHCHNRDFLVLFSHPGAAWLFDAAFWRRSNTTNFLFLLSHGKFGFYTHTTVNKSFQMGRQVVRALVNLDLEIPRNSFTIIMGPSGSGKSTLLYLLGGLDRPTSGSISMGGTLLDRMDENHLAIYRRKSIGFVFQSFNLISSMTALSNVAFPMRFSQEFRVSSAPKRPWMS
jgi:ABC-type glutathione transport system ATPase component